MDGRAIGTLIATFTEVLYGIRYDLPYMGCGMLGCNQSVVLAHDRFIRSAGTGVAYRMQNRYARAPYISQGFSDCKMGDLCLLGYFKTHKIPYEVKESTYESSIPEERTKFAHVKEITFHRYLSSFSMLFKIYIRIITSLAPFKQWGIK